MTPVVSGPPIGFAVHEGPPRVAEAHDGLLGDVVHRDFIIRTAVALPPRPNTSSHVGTDNESKPRDVLRSESSVRAAV